VTGVVAECWDRAENADDLRAVQSRFLPVVILSCHRPLWSNVAVQTRSAHVAIAITWQSISRSWSNLELFASFAWYLRVKISCSTLAAAENYLPNDLAMSPRATDQKSGDSRWQSVPVRKIQAQWRPWIRWCPHGMQSAVVGGRNAIFDAS
jgi:hypothetical protein